MICLRLHPHVTTLLAGVTYCIAGPAVAKEAAASVIAGVGFEPRYVGSIRYARNLEALAELWIHLAIPPVTEAADWGKDFHFQVINKP